MKRITILLIVAMLIVSTVGCGCCRRLRDRIGRGAYCGPASAVTAPAAIASPVVAAPPMQVPVQTPMVAPAPMMIQQPMVTNCIPCDPCCVPCDPCCDPCGGYYGGNSGYYGGMMPVDGGMYDSGWTNGCDSCNSTPVEQAAPSSAPASRDPSPAANDRSF